MLFRSETAEEAERLWKAVDRPNLMIKIPGTDDGVRAIRDTIAKGINVNVTLLFGQEAYKAVAIAHAEGLEERVSKGLPIDRIASVASFFVSRIDSKIDEKIDAGVGGEEAKALKGKVAIANAKLAYAWWQEFVASARWKALEAKGALPQRLLWASTGVKNPAYPDTLYVDTLIGPETVNTMPPKTMDAFRDHGTVAQTLTEDVDGARKVLADAAAFGQERGVKVVVKHHHGLNNTSLDLLAWIKQVNHPNFGVFVDPGNIVYYTGKDPVKQTALIAPYVAGVVAKDCNAPHFMEREVSAPPMAPAVTGAGNPEVMIQFGTGKVDFAGLYKVLKSAGFNGPTMIEGTAVGATLDETIANARANRLFLERIFAAL